MHPLVKDVHDYAKEVLQRHPEHRRAIEDIVYLMEDEIHDGSGISNEADLAYSDLKELDT